MVAWGWLVVALLGGGALGVVSTRLAIQAQRGDEMMSQILQYQDLRDRIGAAVMWSDAAERITGAQARQLIERVLQVVRHEVES